MKTAKINLTAVAALAAPTHRPASNSAKTAALRPVVSAHLCAKHPTPALLAPNQ